MKFALIGYGKMGKAIEDIILQQRSSDLRFQSDEIVLKISENNLADFTIANLQKADVAIEFTQPDSAIANIYKCFEAGVPVVVGTTAWLDKLEEVKSKCSSMNAGLFFSPNFSVGVNIFWEVNRRLAQLMNGQAQYEISIEEIHHTEKKDAPSGTAVKTAEIIMGDFKRKKSWDLQTAKDSQAMADDKLLIVAKREPGVPGTHTVKYESEVDFIELTHEAKSRKGFAEGAILAARWMVSKKGVYEMKDLLKI
ncbi:MAG: 4-hydroxy-tetrahydrodipicolinate reductase [Bacteroidetes bacterium]|nr:4-hydroxy-tetrahydrodipicolinate reductase [Bacteroidota bacterium]